MDVFAKSLAPALGYPEEEVVRWLEAVFQKIAEELAVNGEAHLGELGVLRRLHIPAEPREDNGKLILVPPRYEIRFVEKTSSEGGVVFDVAVEQLELEEDVAQKFSKGFARVIEKVVEVRGSLKLGELGEFARGERGGLTFKQSPILSELLDKPFFGLSPVTISERRKPTPATEPARPETRATWAPEQVATPMPHNAVAASNSRSPSDADASFLKPPALAPVEEPSLPSFSQSNDSLFQEDASESAATFQPPQREPLFIALAAAARAKPESEEEKRSSAQQNAMRTQEVSAPFQHEASVPTRATTRPLIEEATAPIPPSTDDPATLGDEAEADKEGPVLRNIAIATAIVFFTIIIAFVVMKYDSISFTPPVPPAPVDRAKLEAEKAAAARAEAERILAEKSIPKKSVGADTSIIKTVGSILKNATKAAKNLPAELTTIDMSKGGYTIIVASQPTREEAAKIVEEFGKLGLAATIMEKQVGKTIRYRVRVGLFATSAQAAAAKKKHKNVIPSDAFLEKVNAPAR